MTKITPDPPRSNNARPEHVDRDRVGPRPSPLPQFKLPDNLFNVRDCTSPEEALTSAIKILDRAAATATAYESAEKLDTSSRMLVQAVVYLFRTAQELVESALVTAQLGANSKD